MSGLHAILACRRSSRRRSAPPRLAAWLAVVALAGLIGGCASQLADLAEPASTPARPASAPAYPAIHDMPAARDSKPLNADQTKQLVDELSALRERQEAETAADPPPADTPEQPPAKKSPKRAKSSE